MVLGLSNLTHLKRYSEQVAAFRLGSPSPSPSPQPLPTPDPERTRSLAARLLRVLRGLETTERSLVLLGLGSGHLARELAAGLEPAERLIVCELEPERYRELAQDLLEHPLATILADTSPWAHLMLLHGAGLAPGKPDVLFAPNPELDPDAKQHYATLHALLTRSRALPWPTISAPPASSAPPPTVSAAAILHPDEPDLAGFLAQFRDAPSWITELVCVWDGAQPHLRDLPDLPGHIVRRDVVRSLAGDFAAQRNAALEVASSEWVLWLDADERLDVRELAGLPPLLADPPAELFLLPRLTLYPDPDHTCVGYGLWPDPQPRLHRRRPGPGGLAFARPVHERLKGLQRPPALLPGLVLRHLQRLLKSPAELQAKLDGFSAAGPSGAPQHRLPEDLPTLPVNLLAGPGAQAAGILVLPPGFQE